MSLGIGVAVLRHRLYEIDRIVSRTIAYGMVALAVGAIYTIPVVGLPELFGEPNDLVIAGSTLLAAAAFNPLGRHIPTLLDRRFDRVRFDSEIEALPVRPGSALTVESVMAAIDSVVVRSVQPVAVWAKDHRP